MKRILALISCVIAAAFVATAGSATQAQSRSGPLHVTKECSEFNGQAGGWCTITSSNISAIKPGMRVVYRGPPGIAVLDTDIVLSLAHRWGALVDNRTAFGHVVLDLATGTGRVTLSGGTGIFRGFSADAVVSVDARGVWHWDGTYSFARANDD